MFVLTLAAAFHALRHPASASQAVVSALQLDEVPAEARVWQGPSPEPEDANTAVPSTSAADGAPSAHEVDPRAVRARTTWATEASLAALFRGDPLSARARLERSPERPEPVLVARVDRVEPLRPEVRIEIAREPWDRHESEVWGALLVSALAVVASLVQIGIW